MRSRLLLGLSAGGDLSIRPVSVLSRRRGAKSCSAPMQLLTRQHSSTTFPTVAMSGIQPTGVMHIGNYFGAVEQWIRFQQDADCQLIVSIVDLHAITAGPLDSELNRLRFDQMTACLLACGIDADKAVLFQQSSVPEHCLLAWFLTTMSTIEQMNRLAQFKDKAAAYREIGVPLGLLTYPVLQAADILLYKSTHVPVGDDQYAHLEIARKLAVHFNTFYKCNYFPTPEKVISKQCRLKCLRYPEKKMSKSSFIDRGRIDLNNTADEMRRKIERAMTDSDPTITFDVERRPGVSNLISLLAVLLGETELIVVERHNHLDKVAFKALLADAVIAKFEPIRSEYERLMADRSYLRRIISDGSQKARCIADKHLQEIRSIMGMT